MKKISVILALGVLVIIVFGFLTIKMQYARSTDQTARIEVVPSSVDFGNIDQGAGVVSTTVEVKNTGSKSLEINRISTSCGCTTAEIGMSPIDPGSSRVLVIKFDPMAHPDQNGPIVRVVYLQTSDSTQPELEINVVGNVIPVIE